MSSTLSQPATDPARSVALDILRAVAALLVLGNHMPRPPDTLPQWLRMPLAFWKHGGWIGVDLFFVLSGFLVSGLLFREHRRHGDLRVGRFLLRRAFKIYPAFYAFLGTTGVGFWLIGDAEGFGKTPTTWNAVCEVFFVQNYFAGGIWGHTWSLAVEEHFYLGLSGLLLWLSRRSKGKPNGTELSKAGPDAAKPTFAPLPWLFVAVALLLLALRVDNHLSHPFRPGTHVFKTHLRFDSLLFGAVLGYFYHLRPAQLTHLYRKVWRIGLPLAVLVVLISMRVQLDALYSTTVGFIALYLANGMLVLAAVYGRLPSGPLARRVTGVLAFVGVNSYSIYLWHYPVQQWLGSALSAAGLPLPWAVLTPVYFALSIALGVAATRLVEQPALRLRNRRFPSRSGGSILPSASAESRTATAAPGPPQALRPPSDPRFRESG